MKPLFRSLPTGALGIALLLRASTGLADDVGFWKLWPGPSVPGASTVVDNTRHRLVMLGQTSFSPNRVIWSRDLDGPGDWNGFPMPPDAPSLVALPSVVCDAARDRLLIVNGAVGGNPGDVWTLDLASLSTWSRLNTQGGGPASTILDVAWDRGLDRLSCLNDSEFWVLDLAGTPTWRAVAAGHGPPGHHGAARAFDSRRHRWVTEGGATPDWSRLFGSMYDDLWEISIEDPDTAQWRQVPGEGRYRAGHRGNYDASRDQLVASGGSQGWLISAYDSWVMDLGDPFWTGTIGTSLPPGPMALDSTGDALLVQSDRELYSLPLGGGSWSTSDAMAYPAPRSFHPPAVYDSRRNRLMIFGGGFIDGGSVATSDLSNDVWVLPLDELPRWRRLAVAGGGPTVRVGSSAIYDLARDRLVIFGGDAVYTEFHDTWALDLATSTWSRLDSSVVFTAYDAAATYDPVWDRMLVWRADPITAPPQTLEYRFGDRLGWRVLPTGGTSPTSSMLQGSVFDPGRERWIVFGTGQSVVDARPGIWALDLATDSWSYLGSLNGGMPWTHVSGVFDPVRDRLVVFGGFRYETANTTILPTDVRAFDFSAAGGLRTLPVPPISPPPRYFPWMTIDPARDGLVVAGGGSATNGFAKVDDVWTLGWGDLPVRLLEADSSGGVVHARWRVPTLVGQSFDLWRRVPPGDWVLRATGTADPAGLVGFDDSPPAGQRPGYRLARTGSTSVEPLAEIWPIAAPPPPVPGPGPEPAPTPNPPGPGEFLRLEANPVKSTLRFTVHLDRTAEVAAMLLDLSGRPVLRWSFGALPSGDHLLDGGPLPGVRSAVYFLRVTTTSSLTGTKRIALVR